MSRIIKDNDLSESQTGSGMTVDKIQELTQLSSERIQELDDSLGSVE